MTGFNIDVDGLSPLEQTAFLTLYARALDRRCRRPILFDALADQVAGKIDYDFDAMRVHASVRCLVALRTRMLDDRVRRFTAEHPDAVVVDLGAGLDGGIFRCRPPVTVDWYSVDLPAVIELRDAVLPAHRQEHTVAARIDDPRWADAIAGNRPTMLVADGLTGFLGEAAVVALFQTVTDRFSRGELALNDYGRITRLGRAAMKLAPQRAFKAIAPSWGFPGFGDARTPETWNPRLSLVEEVSLAEAPEVRRFPLHLRAGIRAAGHIPALARKARILRYRWPRLSEKTSP
ncbi:MAG TPA: class I SAM-dependent methyltransferase [Mycobacterium sp.]|nr:class I SAM-dependent methyltransferase [Mycobacterium sp.]